MARVDILTSLPTSVSCGVLRDWLSLKSIIRLDSAFCCKKNRGFFIDVLQSDEYFVREQFCMTQDHMVLTNKFNGLANFGKRLRSVSFADDQSMEQGHLLAIHCHNLTTVCAYKPDCQSMWDILQRNVNIEHLELRSCKNVWQSSSEVGSLPNLRALSLSGLGFHHEQVVNMLQMSCNLIRLDLARTDIRNATVLCIPRLCPHLLALGLANTVVILTKDILSELTTLCPKILHLDIEGFGGSEWPTDEGILVVVQNLRGLQSLNIRNNIGLSDASLVHIYTHCADTLHTLYMNGSNDPWDEWLFGEAAVNELLMRCTQLRTLHIDYWQDNIKSDPQITLPATTLSNLKQLVLTGNIVCERNIIAIGKYATKLQILGIMEPSCDCFTPLLEGCPNLKELYLECDIASWRDKRPDLFIREVLPRHLKDFSVLRL